MAISAAADIEAFDFRRLHPQIYMGTASDRYAGWIGQIYTGERYEGRIRRRTKPVGGRTFVEETLPIASVTEYFSHFRVLELDFPFYDLLTDDTGAPTRTLEVLCRYRSRLRPTDRLIVKVPQRICARIFRHGRSFQDNPDYLNAELFTARFYHPLNELMGEAIGGFIFEQEYQRKAQRPTHRRYADQLDAFFDALPSDNRRHMELRTFSLLTGPVLEVFEKHGIGQVLSHWTWLPHLWEQYEKTGKRFRNSAGQAVVRLLTPRGMRYEDAYAKAHPFDRLVEGMADSGMVDDTVRLMNEAVRNGVRMAVIVNNRAGGNAPLIAQRTAQRFAAQRVSVNPGP